MIFISKNSYGEIATPVAVSNFPHMFSVPIFDKARILLGAPEFYSDLIGCGVWANASEEEIRPFLKKEGDRIRVGAVKADVFCQMLAKIAYSFAIAELGYGAFEPLVLPIILGKSTNFGHLIGGDPQPPPPSAHLHEASWEWQIVRLQTYIVVNVRLFGQSGAPQYHVVVGTSGLISPQQRQTLDEEARRHAVDA